MKRMILTLATILMAFSAFAGDAIWLPIAIPQSYWSNPTKKQQIKDAMCEFAGVPQTAEGFAALKRTANWTAVTDVVGNVELGIPAGSDWFINCDAPQNWWGGNTFSNTQYEITYDVSHVPTNVVAMHYYFDINAKADTLRAYTNLFLVGPWNTTPRLQFVAWGIVSQEE